MSNRIQRSRRIVFMDGEVICTAVHIQAAAVIASALRKAIDIAERGHPQSLGGKARANALTPERRSEIARKAAEARWKNNACGKEMRDA